MGLNTTQRERLTKFAEELNAISKKHRVVLHNAVLIDLEEAEIPVPGLVFSDDQQEYIVP